MAVELERITRLENGGVINPAYTGNISNSPLNESEFSQEGRNGIATYVNANNDRHKQENGELKSLANDKINLPDDCVDNSADDSEESLGMCKRGVSIAQQSIVNFYVTNRRWIIAVVKIVVFLLYIAYFAYAMYKGFGDEGSIRLLVCTIIGLLIVVKKFVWQHVSIFFKRWRQQFHNVSTKKAQRIKIIIRWSLYIVSSVAMVTVLIVMVALDTPENLISLAGLTALIILTYITSYNPARVDWHPVYWGFCLQYFFAVIILRTRWGYDCFDWLGNRITEFLAYSDEGASFVFGENYTLHFFAFKVLPVIVFFSSVMSALYYIGVMQVFVLVLGRFLAFCLGTTPAESLSAAANIFLGMTESPLMVRPFVAKMTKSELHAVMVGGFASIAGGVLGAYISFGVPADHLLAASVMSAPAALAISKLTYPETEKPEVSEDQYNLTECGTEQNIIEAASFGASASIELVANVAVNVMAFLSILKFLNATLIWFGDRVGIEGVTFQFICSYVLYPISLFMGTEPRDCRRMAELVGVKTFTNEFIAYTELKVLLDNHIVWRNYSKYFDVTNATNVMYMNDDVLLTQWNTTLKKGFMTRRSEVIATYALCGFSNFGSMGITLGGLAAMAPLRRQDIASMVLRAMIAGNIACFLSATIAGLFYQDFK